MRVLFDEAHSEAWTIRPALAAVMQPSHPGDSSYALAADALAEREFEVALNATDRLDGGILADADVLVIAHPSEPAWERTTGAGSPVFTRGELDAIEQFVAGGGGLVVLGETEQEKYGNNVNDLLQRFGLSLRNDTVQDYEHYLSAPSWILARLADGGRGRDGDVFAGVDAACFYRTTTVACENGCRVLARTHPTASVPDAPLLVAGEHGAGRVVVLGDSDLFGDDCIGELDHRALWCNLVYWVTGGARGAGGSAAAPFHDPAWLKLRDATNELALLQASDGSLADPAAHSARAGELVEGISDGLRVLGRRFPHQEEYLRLAVEDLDGWRAGRYGKPDFGSSLAAFHPERHRTDGIHNLVFFPMYKQNASRETCFEALIARVPWPEWIAALETGRYGNTKFVPVELVDYTRGYDSECAVLFPEMVSVAQRTGNDFGTIFCDREAARLRRVAAAAADLLELNLPPDAALMLRSEAISRDAYILWDLIHDRTHSRGELPFDPFMVRQRAPYWMYSLEELRCDLTAYGEAVSLEGEGVRFARYARYAILLDRLLRFPITGSRIRNYDGLGGQLLFAFLHRGGWLQWQDNRLTIDWESVDEGVASLRTEVEALYRSGIDRSKLAHWSAAHDLVAAYVAPAAGSRWAAGVRSFAELEDPRPYVDEVLDDEFPLSIFYVTLRRMLAA